MLSFFSSSCAPKITFKCNPPPLQNSEASCENSRDMPHSYQKSPGLEKCLISPKVASLQKQRFQGYTRTSTCSPRQTHMSPRTYHYHNVHQQYWGAQLFIHVAMNIYEVSAIKKKPLQALTGKQSHIYNNLASTEQTHTRKIN